MRVLERTGMTAAHAGQAGRIVAGAILRGHRQIRRAAAAARQPGGRQESRAADRRALHEIAPRDGAVHAEFTIGPTAVTFARH